MRFILRRGFSIRRWKRRPPLKSGINVGDMDNSAAFGMIGKEFRISLRAARRLSGAADAQGEKTMRSIISAVHRTRKGGGRRSGVESGPRGRGANARRRRFPAVAGGHTAAY